MNSECILRELLALADPEKAKHLQGYFKTGKGQYAEGDVMLGITVPAMRAIVKRCPQLSFPEITKLLDSPYHEARATGFLLLVRQFGKARGEERKAIFEFYLHNAPKANNWDLVDISCRDVVGGYLIDHEEEREILYRLAESSNLWEQRIAMVSTWTLIHHHQFADALSIAEKLLPHPHDLIHKAVGWMLREVGKKDRPTLTHFLEKHLAAMPRTTLRYAIEHFAPDDRTRFLTKVAGRDSHRS
jgi:3-methyladenine DNA glycosylase AlkD